MVELESTLPGLAQFPGRKDKVPSGEGFLVGRRNIDGAEGLWRIGNRLYDLEKWAHSHPGGSEWIKLTQGTDITEAFEAHHISDRAERLLPKFYVREATTTRSVPLTFDTESFYKKFKQRALVALKNVNYHKPSNKSNMTADFLATTTLATCLLAASTQSWLMIFIAAVFLTWTAVSGHNYFHMRDNFRMYYFDISLMSSKEWRITHVMSHHMYPNTLWDYEMYTFEPYLQWLPTKKSFVPRFLSTFYSPLLWFLSSFVQGIKRYYSAIIVWNKFEVRDLVPLVIPTAMSFVAPSFSQAIGAWLVIISFSSFLFSFIGLSAAHHHPDIFHDGDTYRDSLDWGLLEVDAVRDRRVVDNYHFLTLTNFGSHTLHHLLPTVDHGYLPLCQSAYEETCAEFGVSLDNFTQWELIKGQFNQLRRTQPKKNIR